MCLRSLGFVGLALTLLPACKGSDAESAAIATPAKPDSAPEAPDAAAAKPAAKRSSLGEKEVKELEAMCAAVDHDYIDGTLTDYFRNVKSTTTWGAALQAKADESTTPGRVLLDAMKQGGVEPTDERVPACGRIFDYIDDVE